VRKGVEPLCISFAGLRSATAPDSPSGPSGSAIQCYEQILSRITWSDFETWLKSTRHPLHARRMFNLAYKFHKLAFNNELVFMEINRNRIEIIKSLALLTRFLDVKYDTFLHEQFTLWLKRKEIKWTCKTVSNNYENSKTLTIDKVIQMLNKLPIRYSIFGKFVLSTGLRPEESLRAFNDHSNLCKNGIMELFWDRGTKKANSVYCHPEIHKQILFTMSRGVYNYINKKELGFELRYLRKLNFTINATKIDPLLAEWTQGRRGNISQRHYFLPMMNEHKDKWNKIWRSLLNNTNRI